MRGGSASICEQWHPVVWDGITSFIGFFVPQRMAGLMPAEDMTREGINIESDIGPDNIDNNIDILQVMVKTVDTRGRERKGKGPMCEQWHPVVWDGITSFIGVFVPQRMAGLLPAGVEQSGQRPDHIADLNAT